VHPLHPLATPMAIANYHGGGGNSATVTTLEATNVYYIDICILMLFTHWFSKMPSLTWYGQIVRSVVLASTVSVSATAAMPLNSAIRDMATAGQTVTPAGPVHTAKVILTKYKSLPNNLRYVSLLLLIGCWPLSQAPQKFFDILALYKSDYYYFFF